MPESITSKDGEFQINFAGQMKRTYEPPTPPIHQNQ